MQAKTITDDYKPCLECDKPGQPKAVLAGSGAGFAVYAKETEQLVGYLHANCKDSWLHKSDGSKFTLKRI